MRCRVVISNGCPVVKLFWEYTCRECGKQFESEGLLGEVACSCGSKDLDTPDTLIMETLKEMKENE